jgi:8-oxo-dGTP pyrophosphatase MutT (NUDIX family)
MIALARRHAAEPRDSLLQYGALPWRISRRGNLKVLLITSRETKRWLVPKGWPVKGKSPRQAAMREAFEEAGVFGELDSEPIGAYDYLKTLDDGSQAICSVVLYGLQVRGTLVHWPERAQRKRRWHDLTEATEAVSHSGLKVLFHSLREDLTARA